MEKRLATAAYWIGILSAALALILRGLALFGIYVFSSAYPAKGHPITFRTFLTGAILFFVMAIASGVVARIKERKA
jgi:hypothetical protein